MKFNSFIQTIQYHKMFTKHILRTTSQQYLKRLIANNVYKYIMFSNLIAVVKIVSYPLI